MTTTRRQREQIAAVVELVGTPYRYRGRNTNEGLDCLTCCDVVYSIIGKRFPLPASYTESEIPDPIWVDWMENWQPCSAHDDWPIADMSPHHAGVLLPGAPGRVIHAWKEGRGVVITRLERLHTAVHGFWELRT